MGPAGGGWRGRRASRRSPCWRISSSRSAPARSAGPIKRFPAFIAAVDAAELSSGNVYHGVLRILVGLAKKLIVADVLALTVAESPYVSTARHAWTIVLAFSFQIYFDFSAY